MNDPQTLKKNWMMFSCQQTWPEYQLRDEERWFLEGNINHHAILQLDFFHQEFKKKKVSVPCVQASLVLEINPVYILKNATKTNKS